MARRGDVVVPWKNITVGVLTVALVLAAVLLFRKVPVGLRHKRTAAPARDFENDDGDSILRRCDLTALPAPVQRYFSCCSSGGSAHRGCRRCVARQVRWSLARRHPNGSRSPATQRVRYGSTPGSTGIRVCVMPGLPVALHDTYIAGRKYSTRGGRRNCASGNLSGDR